MDVETATSRKNRRRTIIMTTIAIGFRLGVRPRPRWGSLQRSPRAPSWIWGPLLGRGGARLRKRRERGGRGVEGRERDGPKLLLNQGPSEPCYATDDNDRNWTIVRLLDRLWQISNGATERETSRHTKVPLDAYKSNQTWCIPGTRWRRSIT